RRRPRADGFRVPPQRTDWSGTALALAAPLAGGDPPDDSLLDRVNGHRLPGTRRAVRLLGADLPGDGLPSREALGLPDRRDEPRRFLGAALDPHGFGCVAVGLLPTRGARGRRADRPAGRVPLQWPVPRDLQLRGPIGIRRTHPLLPGTVQRS